MSKVSPELENVAVIGPGSMLAEARIKNGLSIDDVASKLNFRVTLVKDIEADIFDKTLPDTFNRGYLKNYAKLVNLSNADVIEHYEKLNVAEEGDAKMQSFSRGTMKKAENSLLMWITYLILTIFIGFTVMWWLQDDKSSEQQETTATTLIESDIEETSVEPSDNAPANNIDAEPVTENIAENKEEQTQIVNNAVAAISKPPVTDQNVTPKVIELTESIEPEKSPLTKIVFTFAGDCWVNIHDALGERIAWGIKKTGYVMTINAQAPLKITVGKPELVTINFGGENVDISAFPEGHIAKFTLPLVSQS